MSFDLLVNQSLLSETCKCNGGSVTDIFHYLFFMEVYCRVFIMVESCYCVLASGTVKASLDVVDLL